MAVEAKGWKQTRLTILQRDGYTCHYCGAEATEVDHILPRIYGGDESDDNLVAACMKCNRSKGKRIKPVFLQGTNRHPPAGLRISPMVRIDPPLNDCE